MLVTAGAQGWWKLPCKSSLSEMTDIVGVPSTYIHKAESDFVLLPLKVIQGWNPKSYDNPIDTDFLFGLFRE